MIKEEIEVWKSLDFLGYSNYEVSNFGRVKSLNYRRSGKEKILKLCKSKQGYLNVGLWYNGKEKKFNIHRLVALAFVPNPKNLPCINHKDENKKNNHVDNLEFCTHEYNNCYGNRIERISKLNKGKVSPRRKPILQYTKEGIFIREWDSLTTASKELNISIGHIWSCCKNQRKTAGKYIWRYKI